MAYARGGVSPPRWGRQRPSRDGHRRGRAITGWPQSRNSCRPVHGLASRGGPERSQGVGGHRQAFDRDHIASSVPSTSGCIRRLRARAQLSTAIAMRREQPVNRCCSARDPVRGEPVSSRGSAHLVDLIIRVRSMLTRAVSAGVPAGRQWSRTMFHVKRPAALRVRASR